MFFILIISLVVHGRLLVYWLTIERLHELLSGLVSIPGTAFFQLHPFRLQFDVPLLELVAHRFMITQQATVEVVHAQRNLRLLLHRGFQFLDVLATLLDGASYLPAHAQLSNRIQYLHPLDPSQDVVDVLGTNPGERFACFLENLFRGMACLGPDQKLVFKGLVVEIAR